MEITNRARVGIALDLLCTGLRPFIVEHLQSAYGDRTPQEVHSMLRSFASRDPAEWDAQAMLDLLDKRWDAIFAPLFGKKKAVISSLVDEVRYWRNEWAHQQAFNDDDTDRALDSIRRMLTAFGATEQAAHIVVEKEAMQRARWAPPPTPPPALAVRPLPSPPASRGQTVPRSRRVRTPIPLVPRERLLEAIAYFDSHLRHRGEWLTWESNPMHKYAILHQGRRYPVKQIIALAADVERTSFTGGHEANGYVKERGFTVIDLHR